MNEYEGRVEFDGFGNVFLPDTETDMGEVPSIGRWLDDSTGGPKPNPDIRRLRITVEEIHE